MRRLFNSLSRLSKEEKRFWVPALIGVGVAIICLGVSLINPSKWTGYFDIAAGFGFLFWAVCWSKAI